MSALPRPARVLERFAPAFTRPTFDRFVLLAVGAIVTFGRRSVSRVLWAVRGFLDGHPSAYHRWFSRARWSAWALGRVLAAAVLELVPGDGPVSPALDDTADGPHRGKRVYAAACWRDAVASSAGKAVHKWGHKWVVLAVRVRLPFCARPWALPVLVALARPTELDEREGRRVHRTPADLGRGLLATLVHWFPGRRFICLGDWGFGSHDLAAFARRHRRRLTLVARCRADTNLFALPDPAALAAAAARRRKAKAKAEAEAKPKSARRRPPYTCRKGRKLPTPQETVAKATPWTRTLAWYGNGRRDVGLVSGCGGWYRPAGRARRGRSALVPLRWVRSRDAAGGREDYFYSTDPTMSAERIVELYAGRWAIEVTFAEARAHLGLETTRVRTRPSVERAAPCLFGLFGVVGLVYAELCRGRRAAPAAGGTPCYHKADPTFADALAAVRRLLWSDVLLARRAWGPHVTKLPRRLRATLLDQLARAA
jgi:hypothetical protein